MPIVKKQKFVAMFLRNVKLYLNEIIINVGIIYN